MRRTDSFAWLVLALIIGSGAFMLWYVWPSPFPGCDETSLSSAQTLAITDRTDVVKWILGLSVGMTGLFGSFLLRLKSGPALTRGGKVLVLAVICCFSFSAWFALIWRTLMAQALYLNCPTLIADAWIQRSFDALTYFFGGGLAILWLMGVVLIIVDD